MFLLNVLRFKLLRCCSCLLSPCLFKSKDIQLSERSKRRTSNISYSHRKNFAVTAYTTTPHTNSTSICGQQLQNVDPSNATLRKASFSAVSGRNCRKGCIPAGRD